MISREHPAAEFHVDSWLCLRIGPGSSGPRVAPLHSSGHIALPQRAASVGSPRKGEQLVTESYAESTGPARPAGLRNFGFFILKLAVTATCLWYAFRQVN